MAKTVTLLKESALLQIITDLENAVEEDRILAQQARVGAELAKTNSETAMGLSEAARAKSQQWAENPEDTEIVEGKYSALHWASKAQTNAEMIIESAEMLIRHESAIEGLENATSYYNVTNSVPLPTGYYTSSTARAAVPEGVRKTGLILTYETQAGVWHTERYIGIATDANSFTTASNWEVGALRLASVTDTTEYAEITI